MHGRTSTDAARGHLAMIGVIALAAVLVPRLVAPYVALELTYVGAYAIAALGLVVLTGFGGQISLGHGAFVALGAYTVAVAGRDLGLPYSVAAPLAVLLCGIAGLGIGAIALRLSGLYLALATFGAAVSTPPLLKRFKTLTGGVGGITLPSAQPPHALQPLLTHEQWLCSLTWLLVALLLAGTALILRGRLGRSLQALRDSEIAAIAFGVDPALHKTLAFGLSGAYAGVAGAIIALATAYVSPDMFGFMLSITLFAGAVLGGLGSIWGAVIAGILVEFLPMWTQAINAAAPAIAYGLALIVVMLAMPTGIAGVAPAIARRLHARARRRATRADRTGQPTPLSVESERSAVEGLATPAE